MVELKIMALAQPTHPHVILRMGRSGAIPLQIKQNSDHVSKKIS